MSEYESEPIPGLPAHLPAGEEILWQGAPSWTSLVRRALHVRKVAVYFALLLAWSAAAAWHDGLALADAAGSMLLLSLMAGLAIGLLSLLAWLIARTTVYTVTNCRVVVRAGVALPMTINIPFKKIETAALKLHGDGTGDIPLTMSGDDRVAYVVMWPHVRPWRFAKPQPMLRALPDAAAAAEVLGQALAAAAGQPKQQVAVNQRADDWSETVTPPLVSAVS